MSTITSDEVRHVARLARLAMDNERLGTMAGELDQILESMGKIRELDLDDVPPTTHALEIVNVTAEDVVRPSIDREQALSNAPDAAEGCFRVPQMKS